MALGSALIVDSRKERGIALAAMLRDRVLRVSLCDDGYAALATMLRESPDLLFLDAGLGGWGAVNVLQGMERFVLRTRVVLLVGEEDAERALYRSGLVVSSLRHPFRAAELEHLLFGHQEA